MTCEYKEKRIRNIHICFYLILCKDFDLNMSVCWWSPDVGTGEKEDWSDDSFAENHIKYQPKPNHIESHVIVGPHLWFRTCALTVLEQVSRTESISYVLELWTRRKSSKNNFKKGLIKYIPLHHCFNLSSQWVTIYKHGIFRCASISCTDDRM